MSTCKSVDNNDKGATTATFILKAQVTKN